MILRGRNKFIMVRDSTLHYHPTDFLQELGGDALVSFHFNLIKDFTYDSVHTFRNEIETPERYSQLDQYKYIIWLLETYLPNEQIAGEFILWTQELGCSRIPLEERYTPALASSS